MGTVTRQVGASSDDCYRRKVTSFFSLTLAACPGGRLSSSFYGYGTGARFTNITIPKGTTIASAHLKLTAASTRAGAECNTRISAEDVDDAPTFADDAAAFDARHGNHTTAIIDWDNLPTWEANVEYTSPDIKTVIQEIVNRDGWASGNDIVIFWEDFDYRSTGDPSLRTAHSWDGDPAKAPKLVITYAVAYKVTVAEKLGMVDAVTKKKAMYVAVAETLGLKDAVAKKAAYKKLAAEKLGLLDDVKRAKGIHVTAAEKLGLVDDYFKRVTAGRLGDNPDNVGSRGGPIYKDMPDYMGAVYVNTKNTWQDAENLDDVHGYTSYVWVPEEMFSVKILKLHVYAEKFRAYSKAAKEATPGHTHDVIIGAKTSDVKTPSHAHSVSGQTATSSGVHDHGWSLDNIPKTTEVGDGHTHGYYDQMVGEIETSGAHTHPVSGVTSAEGAGSHSHTVDYKTKTSEEGAGVHGHEIEYGIWEDEEISERTLSAILYDPKGNPLMEWDPLTTGEMDVILDLTEYFKDLKYGMYRLELTASGRIRARLVYYELGIMFAV